MRSVLRLNWRNIAIALTDHFERLGCREKLGSNLGQLAAKNRVKPWSVTQSQAKRINEIEFLLFLRDQGVGSSNPHIGANNGLRPVPMFPLSRTNFRELRFRTTALRKKREGWGAEVSPASGRGGQVHVCARFPPNMRDRL